MPKPLSAIIGSSTGEADRDVIAGGWEGTDDATSTAPSDLAHSNRRNRDEDPFTGQAFSDGAGISDIEGHPAESSRDWTTEAVPKDVQEKL